MALFRGHLMGGVAATAVAVVLISGYLAHTGRLAPYLAVEEWPKAAALVVIGLLSACFPDIDTNSHSQRLFYRLLLALDVYLIAQRNYKAAALLGLGAMLPLLGKHRGWTHTWTAAILAPAVFFLAPMLIAQEWREFLVICYVVSVAAYASHLALDGYIGKTVKRAGWLVGRR